MPEIKKYNYDLFSIDVCQRCFSYRFNHDSGLVFHRINASHLDNQESLLIVPRGIVEASYYLHYLGKRSVHLGPLFSTPLVEDNPERIWFGFDINKIKEKYPELRFIDYSLWSDLVWHSHAHPPAEGKEMREKLFISDYSASEPTLVILPHELDCSLAEVLIARTEECAKKAKQFAGKNLESVIFDLDSAKKIWQDYLDHLNRSEEEWQRFLHEPGYHFPECGCGIE